MNIVNIIGNLTKDWELRYLPDGRAVANNTVAVTKRWRDQSGQQHENTTFLDVTIFGKGAETLQQYTRKGSRIGVTGELAQDNWTAQDGSKRSKIKIVVRDFTLLDCKGQKNASSGYENQRTAQEQRQTYTQQQKPPQTQQAAMPEIDMDDTEIPF